mgnify:CR=1 FL=1
MQTFIERYFEQGEQSGEAKLLLHQIESKFGEPSPAIRQRIQEADADTLLSWAGRILTAETPEAIFH